MANVVFGEDDASEVIGLLTSQLAIDFIASNENDNKKIILASGMRLQ